MTAQNPVSAQPLPTRAARLDRLSFGPQHTRMLVGSGIGWALDAMDVGLISYVMTALAHQWHLNNGQLSWIASIGFVGMALGASLGGLLADRVGRRNVFALTLLIYGLATGAAALSVSVAMLIALRLVVGFGLGAELPVASTLVSEFAPQRIRGRMIVLLESFWALGWLLAALLGYFLVPSNANGWRWALVVGVVPALYAIFVRWGLPESVRFLESKGRLRQAEGSVRRFEQASGVTPAVALEQAVVETPLSLPSEQGTESIFSPRLRGRTIALWLVWAGINLSYYGAFTWIPTLLYQRGMPMVRSFGFTLIMTLAQIPGYLAAAWLVERWGRRATLASFLAASAVAAGIYGIQTSPAGIIAAGCTLSFFNLGAWGALYAIGPEIYPTTIRGTGTGAASAIGRLAAIAAPLLVPILVVAGGEPLTFAVFGVAFAMAAGAALFLPERRARQMVE